MNSTKEIKEHSVVPSTTTNATQNENYLNEASALTSASKENHIQSPF